MGLTLMFNMPRSESNDQHAAGNIFKYIFLQEMSHILVQISLQLIAKSLKRQEVSISPCNGDKPLLISVLARYFDATQCINLTDKSLLENTVYMLAELIYENELDWQVYQNLKW